jgi:hypothetical protein
MIRCLSLLTPRWGQSIWARRGWQSGLGSIAEKSLKNFNSRSLNALPREGDSGPVEIDNLELTGLSQRVT